MFSLIMDFYDPDFYNVKQGRVILRCITLIIRRHSAFFLTFFISLVFLIMYCLYIVVYDINWRSVWFWHPRFIGFGVIKNFYFLYQFAIVKNAWVLRLSIIISQITEGWSHHYIFFFGFLTFLHYFMIRYTKMYNYQRHDIEDT